MFVTDSRGRATGWILLHAPIQSPSRKEMFAEYRRRGFGFIGMSSFMSFPTVTDASELDYSEICEGWAHCFREPDRFLPERQPRVMLALSDFTDPARISPHRFARPRRERDAFDFIYVGADATWKMTAKNWPLASRCLPRLCGELGLSGLAVGVDRRVNPEAPGLTMSPWLPYEDFLRVMAGCKFLFVPNELDASPRVLAEALCLNVPLLVNRALLGGWHYVAPSSGVFFDDEHDVVEGARRCMRGRMRPRAWYLSQFGPGPAGRKLFRLVKTIDPDFDAPGPLGLSYAATARDGGG